MRLSSIKAVLFLLFPLSFAFSQEVAVPQVKIEDHTTPVPNTGVINIDCDYEFLPGKKIGLTAVFPKIHQTNDYVVESIDYLPFGNFNEGEPLSLKANVESIEDDVFSEVVPLTFDFCYFGGTYNQVTISDNGVLSFKTALAGGSCSSAPVASIPYGLHENSVFGVFHDLLSEESEGIKIRTRVEGIAPNRRFIVNYDKLSQYSYDIKGYESSSQIVLYESSNIIDVYVKDRYKNLSNIINDDEAYLKNAAIGLTNADSSYGIAAPDRDSGNWDAHNEAWRFTPAGSLEQTIKWLDGAGREISGTRDKESIQVSPTGDTKYSVEVTYKGCNAIIEKDEIEVKFSQDFPTAKEVDTPVFCVNNGDSYTIDLNDYNTEINSDSSLTFTYFEDSGLTKPIANPEAYAYSNNQIVYVKVHKSGICYSVGKLNLKINSRPVIATNQSFEVCDTDNDGKETINLSRIGILGLGNSYFKFFATEADAITGTSEINKNTYEVDVTSSIDATKTLYIRVWNKIYNDENCFSIFPFTISLKKVIRLKDDVKGLVCYVTNGQDAPNQDLTKFEEDLIDFPKTGLSFEYYTDVSYNSRYKIKDPSSATFKVDGTIYVLAKADGYCEGKTSILIEADDDCDGEAGGGGGNGQGGGAGVGAICDSNVKEQKVNLEEDYLKHYLPGTLSLTDIVIEGFYDLTTNTLITAVSPYEYTFELPHFKYIRAKYTVKGTNEINTYTDFPVRGSMKSTIKPDTFEVCDTYKDGIGKEILKLETYINKIEETYGAGARVLFFKTHEDLVAQKDNASLKKNIYEIELTIESRQTVYVWVEQFGCNYEHELYFDLLALDSREIGPLEVCDFDSDEKEEIDLTAFDEEVKNKLFSEEKPLLIGEVVYYLTEKEASLYPKDTYPNKPIDTPGAFEISTGNMAVFARLELDEQCPVFVKLSFTFTTSVAMPTYIEGIDINKAEVNVCDTNNDGHEDTDLNDLIASVDADSEVSFFTDKEAAEINNISYRIGGGVYDGEEPILYKLMLEKENIYMRVLDTKTSCVAVRPITFNLIGYPKIKENRISLCDFADDGEEIISATDIQTQLIRNNPNILFTPPKMVYTFFKTEADALANTNLINSIVATNTNSIWVRIVKNVGECPMTFELKFVLIPPPTLEDKVLEYTICNNNTSNENAAIKETITLNNYRDDILGTSPTNDHVFTFFENEADAINGTNGAVSATDYTLTSFPKEIWARVQLKSTGCFSIKKIEIKQYPTLENSIRDTEIKVCATEEMSKVVDLEDYPREMLEEGVKLSDFEISYHTSRADAVIGNGITSDINNYTVTAESPIWIKFIDIRPGSNKCHIIKKLGITLYDTPKARGIYLNLCDESDGSLDGRFVIKDLNEYRSLIIRGEDISAIDSKFTFSYYPDIESAENLIIENQIDPLNFTFNQSDLIPESNLDTYTLYVRIDKTDGTGCFNVVSIQFRVAKKPSINPDPIRIVSCVQIDSSQDKGKSIFDLTSVEGDLTTESAASFTYFSTEVDARTYTNEILAPSTWTNLVAFKDEVYVRIAVPDKCDVLTSIDLEVYIIEAEDYDLGDLCEFDLEGNLTKVDLTLSLPQMLKEVEDPIRKDLLIVFYTTREDAEGEENSIGEYEVSNPITDTALTEYLPAIGNTTIYLRFTSKDTGCYVVKELTMKMQAAPEIAVLDDLVVCDEDLNELFDDFILKSLDASLISNPLDYTITYHSSLADAWANTKLINKTKPWAMQNIPISIGVRIVNNKTGCVNSQEIHFKTNPILPLKKEKISTTHCDENDRSLSGFNDGKSIFNLTDFEDEIIDYVALLPVGKSIQFTYYKSREDASLERNPIPNRTAYTNTTAYNEVVYVRISADEYCDNLAEIHLNVTPSILARDFAFEKQCELMVVDGAGIKQTIDLSTAIPKMLKEVVETVKTDLLVSFHTTELDAEGNSSSFGEYDVSNPVADTALTEYLPAIGKTTLYLRFTSKTSGCYVVRELEIELLEAPEINHLEEVVVCDENLNSVFDDFILESLDASLVASPLTHIISYHNSLTDAWNNTSAIDKASPWAMPSNPISIGVRVVAKATGCVNVQKIDFKTNPVLPLEKEEVSLTHCDENDSNSSGFNDGKSVFDLTELESELLGSLALLPAEETAHFTYYTSFKDASLEQNAIADPSSYTNSKPHEETIYVRVSAKGYCDIFAEIHLQVTPSILAQDTGLEICEYVNGTSEKTRADLTLALPKMLEQVSKSIQGDLLVSFHTNYEDAEEASNSFGEYDMANPVASSSITAYLPTATQTSLYLRFTSKASGCFVVKKLEVEVLESPIESFSTSLVYCDPNNDEEGTFYLPDAIPNITTDPEAIIGFYRTLADAHNQANPLPESVNNNELGGAPPNSLLFTLSGRS